MEYSVPIVAYLCPLVLGLVVAFLVARSDFIQQGIAGLGKIILYYITLPLIIIMVMIGLDPNQPVEAIESEVFPLTFVNLIWLFAFLWGWLVMVAGVSYLLITIRLNKNIVYLIVSFLILLVNATIFYINPFIKAWQNDLILRQWIIKASIAVNPMLTIASSFFGHDLLRSRVMYSLCDIGPYYFYNYPDWTTVLFWYILIGICAFGVGILIRSRPIDPP